MPQKCFCGVELEIIKKGRILRCPVEGIIYEYPNRVSSGEGAKS
jgi:hypothetical protein